MGEKILIVDDEEDILELLRHNLTKEGYEVIALQNGNLVVETAKKEKPDLITLDLMLPEISGLEICKKLRQEPETKLIPIIMLTAKSEDFDEVIGLDTGANDYITKPFSPKVLIARIRNQLKTEKEDNQNEILTVHNIEIHSGKREVLVNKEAVKLTHSEFEILKLLVQKPGWVFSRYQIVDIIRGKNYAVTERSIDVQIVGLRKKLGDHGKYIETVRGVGYKFQG